MIQINLKSSTPIYEQIKNKIKELISFKVLLPEDKIPSVRELAVKLTVNPNTVQRAYRELEQEGYIYKKSGRGTFIATFSQTLENEASIKKAEENLKKEIENLIFSGMAPETIKHIVDETLKAVETLKKTYKQERKDG